MKETFAGKIRNAGQLLGADGLRFTIDDLCHAAGLQTYENKRRVRLTLRDLTRSGEFKRVEPGVYLYVGKSTQKPQKQAVMLELLKMRRTVTVEDLQELAGVSADYAKEWLQLLVRREVVRAQQNGKYTLIKDTVEMPVNEEKAERLRELRSRKKAFALKELGKIKEALGLAEAAIMDIE